MGLVLTFSLPYGAVPLFDFRSQRFRDDARRLVMTTGHCLDRCRQALFIAEGDVEEARADLLAAANAPAHGFGFVLH